MRIFVPSFSRWVRFCEDFTVVQIITSPSWRIFALRGMRSLLSRTIFVGLGPCERRTLSWGLSVRIVLMPTRIASAFARSLWTYFWDVFPVIFVQVGDHILKSMLEAIFKVM